jgi:hypothetical protein
MVNGSHFSAIAFLVKSQIKPRSELKLILARDREHQLRLWACRGNGRGCQRNRYPASRRRRSPSAPGGRHGRAGRCSVP